MDQSVGSLRIKRKGLRTSVGPEMPVRGKASERNPNTHGMCAQELNGKGKMKKSAECKRLIRKPEEGLKTSSQGAIY